MRDKIVVIGDDLRINQEFLSYIFEEYEAKFGELGEIKFVPKNSKDLPFIIENLAKECDMLTIFGADDSYATTSKILATLSSDILELKAADTLAPKGALKFTKDSFLIKLGNTKINLIRAVPTQKLGEILGERESGLGYFCLFDIDIDSARLLLAQPASTYDVKINLSELISGLVLVRAQANKFGQVEGFLQNAKGLFPQKMLFGRDPIKFIAQKLMQNRKKITFAESCTAGSAAAKFARYGGVSAAFDGSLVTYANEIKHNWIGVKNEILDSYGAVSEQCVKAMLNGVLVAANADFALAISGIAGPDGGTASKPVGTVFVGAMNKNKNVVIERLLLKGGRNYIREQSVLATFACLFRLDRELFFS